MSSSDIHLQTIVNNQILMSNAAAIMNDAEDIILGQNGKVQDVALGVMMINQLAVQPISFPRAIFFKACLYDPDRGPIESLMRRLGEAIAKIDRVQAVIYTLWNYCPIQPDRRMAVSLLVEAANKGDAEAQYNFAQRLASGQGGVTRDPLKAEQFYQLAGFKRPAGTQYSQGHAGAQYKLGMLYKDGPEDTKHFAPNWLRLAADQGHADAQYELGKWHLSSGDETMALNLFRLAADQGHAGAKSELDKLHLERQNQKSAADWLRLGKGYLNGQGDAKSTADLFYKEAELGNAHAQYQQGLCYLYGKGVDRDLGVAADLFYKAAGQGHPDAQYQMGLLYEMMAKSQDADAMNLSNQAQGWYKLAVGTWFPLAVEKNDAKAQFKLARCFENGRGVPKNPAAALAWYHDAAKQGHIGAQIKLGHKDGPVTQLTIAYWRRKATKQNQADAQFQLGLCYQCGRGGVTIDISEAIHWYAKAALQEHPGAQYQLGLCCEAIADSLDKSNPMNDKLAAKWRRLGEIQYAQAKDKWLEFVPKDAAVKFKLARCIEKGRGVTEKEFTNEEKQSRLKEAQRLYLEAANEGNADAQYYQGIRLQRLGDFEAAKDWFQKAATRRHAAANSN